MVIALDLRGFLRFERGRLLERRRGAVARADRIGLTKRARAACASRSVARIPPSRWTRLSRRWPQSLAHLRRISPTLRAHA